MTIKEGQVWRKEGPGDWLKIIQILDPDYGTYDGGKHGCIVHCYPDQLKGIQLRGGRQFFIADNKEETWEGQIMRNRFILKDGWKRGDSAWDLKQ